MHVLAFYVGWPYGADWSNLQASAIVGILGFGSLHFHLRRIHASVRKGNENQASDAQGIRTEERRQDLLRNRKQEQDPRTATRKDIQMSVNTSFVTGFWATIGVLGAVLLVSLLLGVFSK